MTDITAKVRRHTLLSLVEGEPTVGIGNILPGWLHVHTNAPVHEWSFRKVGKRRYHLGVGGYPYTGVLEGKIIASLHPHHNQDWIVTWPERATGFLIESPHKPGYGWKVSEDGEVVLGVLIATSSIPPIYPSNQLFRFKGLVGEDLEKLPIEHED